MASAGGIWISSTDHFGRRCWINNATNQITYDWARTTPIISQTIPPVQQFYGYGSSPPQYITSPPVYGGAQRPQVSLVSPTWGERRDAFGKRYWVNMRTFQATYRDPFV